MTDAEAICYSNRYPDLKAAFGEDKGSLHVHWANTGIKEGRDKSCPAAAAAPAAAAGRRNQFVYTNPIQTLINRRNEAVAAGSQQTHIIRPRPTTVLEEGKAYRCSANDPGGDNSGFIYRYTGDKLRWYPTPKIASSWDRNWLKEFKEVDCAGYTKGDDMIHKRLFISQR
jgi:hypothetical protein